MRGGHVSFPLTHHHQQLFLYGVVLTTKVAFIIAEWTVCAEVTQFVKRDAWSLVTVVLTLQCDVGAR